MRLEAVKESPASGRGAGGTACPTSENAGLVVVAEILAVHRDREELFREYPFLEEEDLQQALRYAAASIDEQQVELNRVA